MVRLKHGGDRAGRRQAALLVVLLSALVAAFMWKFSVVSSDTLIAYSQPVRRAISDASEALGNTDGSGRDGAAGGSDSEVLPRQVGTGRHVKDVLGRLKYPPIAAPDKSIRKERCGATKGDWCGRYDAQVPIPAKAPPRGDRKCLWGDNPAQQCNFVGVCDNMMGWCRCPAGWNGDDCSRRMRRPCSQHHRPFGFEPYDQPTDPSQGGTTLACADLCDDDIAHCYCNSTFPHGRIPADPSDPPGTPPKRRGRPIAHLCRRGYTDDGKKSVFGSVALDALYGEQGWCVTDSPHFDCPCLLDGMGGPTCEKYYEAFCPNQCNGHGECLLGFCKCHEGWFGTDCAQRTADTPWSPGMEAGERPWLKPVVHTPAARDPEPGATRKRPLIYVYDLPPMYNAIMLQYRVSKFDCVHRQFTDSNTSFPVDHWLYQPETGLHEMLLQSEHRTLDPSEADFFYLPVYSSCLIFPILFSNDFPFFHSGPVAGRTHGATNMYIEVYSWIRSHYPYWDRNGGRDHIVLSVHDEGSCWVPAVLRPAIILSHWGRTDANHTAGSGYGPDDYSNDISHPVWQPEGHLSKLGKFPCYDPSKDMVLPLMSSPNKYAASPLLGAPTRKRTVLAFFKGRIQPDNPPYSRGTRQFLANFSATHDWWGKHRIWIADGAPPEEGLGGYSEALASSTFCLALMGDGYSSRFDDAVLHGCIPVIIQDGVELTWHALLDIESYSVRIAQKDMERIPEILKAVSEQDIARMQANLAKVWRRHIWTGYRPYGEQVRGMLAERRNATEAAPLLSQPPPVTDYDPAEDDALSTLIQWLYSRLDDLGAHAPPPKQAAAAAA